MAIGHDRRHAQADDVNFADPARAVLPPAAAARLHRPRPARASQTRSTRTGPVPSPLATSQSYPARRGHDQFYGYGRVNMAKASARSWPTRRDAARRSRPRPRSPHPSGTSRSTRRSDASTSRRGLRARRPATPAASRSRPASSPNNGRTTDIPPGDFQPCRHGWCDGSTHTSAVRRRARDRSTSSDLQVPLPARRPELQRARAAAPSPPNDNGRPNTAPHGFVVKLVVTRDAAAADADRPGPARRSTCTATRTCCPASRAS